MKNLTHRILLVEDDESDVELTLKALSDYKDLGRITVAKNGEEAIRYLRSLATAEEISDSNPGVILLDLKMPKVGGIDVLKEIRSDPLLHLVPVVIFTSSAERNDIYQCYENGANAYVVKPLDFASFIKTLQAVAKFWLEINQEPNSQVGRMTKYDREIAGRKTVAA
ncbi:MAG: response regulator [Terrimicrobiaceae bacterium]